MNECETLSGLLPQSHPMILLSGFTPTSDPASVESWVDITDKSPFFDAALGGVPGCVALEYMAQTMALSVGLMRRRKGLAPKLGFVLGSRKLEVFLPCFRCSERYSVRVDCTYQDESFGSFNCVIADAAGMVAATAQMTAFQPEGEVTPEIMEAFT